MPPPVLSIEPPPALPMEPPSSTQPPPVSSITELEVARAELARARQAQADAERSLEAEVTRRIIAEYRAEHFYRRTISDPTVDAARAGMPLHPCVPSDVPRRGALADSAPEFLRVECMFCMGPIDSTGGYTIGCGHTYHLACLLESMVQIAQCPLCQYIIDLATYRVLGIDDVFPGTRRIDPRTRAPVSHTTREDLEALLRAEGHDLATIDPEFFEPASVPWLPTEVFEVVARIDRPSTSSGAGSSSSAGPSIFSRDHLAQIHSVEERTRIEWMQRVAADHELWLRRQRVLLSARESEAQRAMLGIHTGDIPVAAPLPPELGPSSIVDRVRDRRAGSGSAPVQVVSDDEEDPDYRVSQD